MHRRYINMQTCCLHQNNTKEMPLLFIVLYVRLASHRFPVWTLAWTQAHFV